MSASDDSNEDDMHAHLIFCGNPGAGKSTLLNGLIGKVVFKSGVSAGGGLTSQLDWYHDDEEDLHYADTPGLDDNTLRKAAAAAITEALRQNGFYKLVFVVLTDDGRVRPSDAITIKLVLDAIPEYVPYGIVVNQVRPKLLAKIESNADGFGDKIRLQLMKDHRITSHVFFNPEVEALSGEDNALPAPNPALENFLETLPVCTISRENVNDVRSDAFEEEREKMENKLADVRKATADLEARTDLLKKMNAQMSADAEKSRAKLKQMNEQLAKARQRKKKKGCLIQ